MAKPNGTAEPVGGFSIDNPVSPGRRMFVLIARSEDDDAPVELSIDHLVAYLSPAEAGHLAMRLEQAATDAMHASRSTRRQDRP